MIMEDSTISPQDSKHGYYKVGNKFYNKKFNALIEASRVKQNVEWNFNYNLWQKYIGMPRTHVSLDELYIRRAKQLREKYKYLILGYSGGSDSDNILQVFLKNNIKIDELWCDFPITLINKCNYVPNKNTDATNMASEWFYVINPELKNISEKYPEIKIHISDSFSNPTIEDYEDSVTIMSQPSAYTSIKRYRYIENYITNLNSNNLNAALMLGMEKPLLYLFKNNYGFYFVDTSTYCKTNLTSNKQFIVEYFYWTPDFPEITIEQAKRAWEVLLLNPEFAKQRITENQNSIYSWMDRSKGFDNFIKKICYPNWDFSKHQVNKSGMYYNNQFSVFLNKFNNSSYLQSYHSNVKTMLNILDPLYAFQNKKNFNDDLSIYFNFHKLGEVDWNLSLPKIL